jgi:hypothetical protein
MSSAALLQNLEKTLLASPNAISGAAAVEAILSLSSVVKQQQFLSDVIRAIRLLAIVFLEADNMLRSTIVASIKHVGLFAEDFPEHASSLLSPIVRVVSATFFLIF